ncbi:hypothetical protein A2U01_0031304, partial [Trifolium medium]|nr:hypothetical protein [Trifolium medium]
MSRSSCNRCGTLPNTVRLWGVNINGGWLDQNLIAGGPTDREGGSDTILELRIWPYLSLQNRLI